MTKILIKNNNSFFFVQILSSIIQIVVTCAFSVQACVLTCTLQIDKERAVNMFYLLLCVLQEGKYLVF